MTSGRAARRSPQRHPDAVRIGRRPATDHDSVEAAALELFWRNGFEQTTIQDIADACGIGRRTVFRYFPSKDDIPWGSFDDNLEHLAAVLRASPGTMPLHEAVHRAVLDFNRLDAGAVDQHRVRMTLILRTPALQAHSALRYAGWRQVIAGFVADRHGLAPDDMLPQVAGHVALALALAAYERWLADDRLTLAEQLDEAMSGLRTYLGG